MDAKSSLSRPRICPQFLATMHHSPFFTTYLSSSSLLTSFSPFPFPFPSFPFSVFLSLSLFPPLSLLFHITSPSHVLHSVVQRQGVLAAPMPCLRQARREGLLALQVRTVLLRRVPDTRLGCTQARLPRTASRVLEPGADEEVTRAVCRRGCIRTSVLRIHAAVSSILYAPTPLLRSQVHCSAECGRGLVSTWHARDGNAVPFVVDGCK